MFELFVVAYSLLSMDFLVRCFYFFLKPNACKLVELNEKKDSFRSLNCLKWKRRIHVQQNRKFTVSQFLKLLLAIKLFEKYKYRIYSCGIINVTQQNKRYLNYIAASEEEQDSFFQELILNVVLVIAFVFIN